LALQIQLKPYRFSQKPNPSAPTIVIQHHKESSMRSRTVMTFAIVTMLFAATSVQAQNRGQFGLGVGLSSSFIGELTNSFTPTIYLPIMASDQVMIEPGFGMVRVSDDNSTETTLALQAGILFMLYSGQDDRIYVGPRIGLLRQSVSVDDPDFEDSEANFSFSGVAGGEFFLRELFSLGGEIGLRYFDADNGSLLSTTAEFRIRWYFSQ
jgi:hypothetical protein